jgi:hypothetical protein
LLVMPPLGDRRPTHLMNEILALLPVDSNKDNSLFLGMFLRKLPASMRDHLAAKDHQTATEMSRHADVLWDACCSESGISAIADVSAVSRPPRNSHGCSPNRHKSPVCPGNTGQNRKQTPGPDGRCRDFSLCFFHDKWGSEAKKCQSPCAWSENYATAASKSSPSAA